MGLMLLAIYLDRPIYYSGDIISGRLLVQVDKPMSIRGIYLEYSGQGTVQWHETQKREVVKRRSDGSIRRKNEKYTENYSDNEHYLEVKQRVFGNGVKDCKLAKGEQVFVFNCQLPVNLPSSFEGLHGRVRYSIKATIKRSWKSNHVATHSVTIMSVCDLNHIPLAATPVVEKMSKKFWGHCISKPLFVAVYLPVRGFVPGQIIPINVFLNNRSGVRVKSLYVTLEQNVTFHATHKSKTVKINVLKNKFPVPKGLGYEEVPLNLQLPAVPPSQLQFCKIIDLNYQLNVEAKVKAWYHGNLEIRTEVIVGSIPLINSQMPIPVHQLQPDMNHKFINSPNS